MSERFLLHARLKGGGVTPRVAVDAAGAGDHDLEQPTFERTVGEAVRELREQCEAIEAAVGKGKLEVHAVTGGDEYGEVCAILGAIARGLARSGKVEGVVAVRGDAEPDGELLTVRGGRVTVKRTRTWRAVGKELDRCAELVAKPASPRAGGRAKAARRSEGAARPAADDAALAELLAKKRLTRDQEEALPGLMQAAIEAGREAVVIAALDHPLASMRADRALLRYGSRTGLEALARRFDGAWTDFLAVRQDWIAAILKLDPKKALDRFRPALDAALAGRPGAEHLASTIVSFVTTSFADPKSASSWAPLGVPFDVPAIDPRWAELADELQAVPRCGHARAIVDRARARRGA